MVLGLSSNKSHNKYLVIHEFGHALGMEHEHQRSKFWSEAEKFLDVDAMLFDDRMEGVPKTDLLEKLQKGNHGSQDYDSESVMHYW